MAAENFQPISEEIVEGTLKEKEDEAAGIEELLKVLKIPAPSFLKGWRDNYLKNLLEIEAALEAEIAKMPEGKRKEAKKLELAELKADINGVREEVARLEEYVEAEKGEK